MSVSVREHTSAGQVGLNRMLMVSSGTSCSHGVRRLRCGPTVFGLSHRGKWHQLPPPRPRKLRNPAVGGVRRQIHDGSSNENSRLCG